MRVNKLGFTLIELIIFILIVGIASVGLFAALNQHNLSSVNPMYQIRALELAQAQMDEIYGKRYDENSPNGGYPPCGSSEPGAVACSGSLGADGEGASEFDDVDDYQGFSTSVNGFDVSVTVVQESLGGQPAKRILVRVDPPAGNSVELGAYRANY